MSQLAQANPLTVGAKAPAFSAETQDGQVVSSESLKGQPILVYFYPKDDTPGCTKEACGFRDNYSALKAKGVVILGVSGDTAKSHAKFAKKYSLPFPLLADTDLKIAKAFGAYGEKTFMGRKFEGIHRMTFLIGTDGKIKHAWTKVKAEAHPDEVLAALNA